MWTRVKRGVGSSRTGHRCFLFHNTLYQVYGDGHTDLDDPAASFMTQGRHDDAEPLYRQSLEICRKVCTIHFVASYHNHSCQALGEEHPDVATSLNNLVGLLNVQGMYNESIPMLRRSLKIRRKVFGENHPDMAESLNNLAEVLREQDKHEEAEPHLIRCLDQRNATCKHQIHCRRSRLASGTLPGLGSGRHPSRYSSRHFECPGSWETPLI
jgi:tetratricopeptide (TPR) repeat protein